MNEEHSMFGRGGHHPPLCDQLRREFLEGRLYSAEAGLIVGGYDRPR